MSLISVRSINLIFQCEEKSDISKLHGFLPVKKYHLIIGRYLYVLLIGIISLFLSFIIQSILLNYLKVNTSSLEFIISLIWGLCIYIFNVSIQLPGFYKYGSIKGSFFCYVPIVFFFIAFYFLGGFNKLNILSPSFVMNNLSLISIVLLCISIALILISIKISLLIYKKYKIV